MSLPRRVLAFLLLSSVLIGGLLVGSDSAAANHCPLFAPPTGSQEAEAAGCYYPEVSVSANPSTVTVNSGTSTISYSISGANPSIGCVKSGGWSGSIQVDGSGNASGLGVVGPFSATGTIGFSVSCPADPVNGYAGTTVTVTSSPPPPPPPSSNNAGFVGQSVPTSLVTGQRVSVSVTLSNTGTTTWTAASGYKLGSQNPQDNTLWGLNRALLGGGDSIAPGQSKTFGFSITAPTTTGTYNFQWRMVREGVEWFGASSANVAINVVTDSSIQDYALDDAYGAAASGTDAIAAYRQGGAVYCRTIKPWVRWSQVVTGLRLWTYRQDVTWCWDNKKITSVSRNRYADVNGFPGNPWSFEGHQGTNCNVEDCSDKAFGTSQTITTQGKFRACAFVVVFCKDKNPYIEVIIQRGGGFTLVKATP